MSNVEKKPVNVPKQILGYIIFFLVFVVYIPLLIYKYKKFTLLEGYLPNVDLIASSLSWHGGPFGIWKFLYPINVTNSYGFISEASVNYMALLSLTFLVARESVKHNNIIKGWSMGFVMILMTYLLPSNLVIIPLMDTFHSYLPINNLFIVHIFGLLVAAAVIYLETLVLKYTGQHLNNLGKFITRFPKQFVGKKV